MYQSYTATYIIHVHTYNVQELMNLQFCIEVLFLPTSDAISPNHNASHEYMYVHVRCWLKKRNNEREQVLLLGSA